MFDNSIGIVTSTNGAKYLKFAFQQTHRKCQVGANKRTCFTVKKLRHIYVKIFTSKR